MLSSVLVLLTFLTACEITTFNVYTPDIAEYSPEVQEQAANELDALGPPCAPDVVYEGCSAVKRLVVDYKFMRDQTRALKDKE